MKKNILELPDGNVVLVSDGAAIFLAVYLTWAREAI